MWQYLLSALAATTIAAPTRPDRVLHEKRTARNGVIRLRSSRLEHDAIVPVRIALTQRNIDQGYDYLMEVSHPSSKTYGKHWTAEQVAATFGPSDDSVATVMDWLNRSRISDARKTATGWVAFEASAFQVEQLLETEIYEYHSTDGTVRLGCDQYHLPQHVAPHVDYLTPGVGKFSQPVRKTKVKRWGNYGGGRGRNRWNPPPTHRPPHWGQPWQPPPGIPAELQGCGRNITPPCIRALYDIPQSDLQIDTGILGVVEALGDMYSQEDLDAYFATYVPSVPNGTHPTLVSINGATAPAPQASAGPESDIDFDLAYALLGNAPITLYQVQPPANLPDDYTGDELFGTLLDALDGSFCDQEDESLGFQCGGAPLSTVTSISYGGPEIGFSYNVSQRVCNEIMKLSLQGHTFVLSSGDYGVATNPPDNVNATAKCNINGCIARDLQSDENGPIFNPQYPAVCPYVLSVGATQLEPDQTVQDAESALYQPAVGEQQKAGCANSATFFSSSGGFSNYFPRQKYQETAVATYFADHDPGYAYYETSGGSFGNTTSGINSGIYNRAGRGYPDVSANGANLNVIIRDTTTQTFGTSLATPIWAALLAMINQKRQNAGKSPVGFVNAVLYEHTEIFHGIHDITNGSNPGCGTNGFSAVSGWDPVTGLGTPDYSVLEKVFLNLP